MKIGLGLLLLCSLAVPDVLYGEQTSGKPESSRLEFVKMFIHNLSAIEEIREKGEKEQKGEPDGMFRNMIHSGTLFKLELGAEIVGMESIHFKQPFDTLPSNLTGFYKNKYQIWDRMVEIARQFNGGPKPGVDYDKLSSEMSELRAKMEFIDQSIFQASPIVFATLIDMKANSKSAADHLIITKAERADLIEKINAAFGAKLDEKNPNYIVGAGQILRTYLQKGYKALDEPWD